MMRTKSIPEQEKVKNGVNDTVESAGTQNDVR